jgi:hypothetical protein
MRRVHRAGGPRVLGARRRFAPLRLPAGRFDRPDEGPLEGPVPRRPGNHRRRRRGRAPDRNKIFSCLGASSTR